MVSVPRGVQQQDIAARRIQELCRRFCARRPRARILLAQEIANECMTHLQYRPTIHLYSHAIRLFEQNKDTLSTDVFVHLKANRASALLKLGAYDAACSEFESAVELYPMIILDAESSEVKLVWQHAHCLQMAHAFILSGHYKRANEIYQDILRATHAPNAESEDWVVEATTGQATAKCLDESIEKAERCFHQSLYAETLEHVQTALAITPGCKQLIEWKTYSLAALQRWRELVGFLERLACLYASIENVYKDDVARLAPSPGISPVQTLDPKFFGEVLNETALTAAWKLPVASVAEAVLRLPYPLIRFYIRGLRLEGSYSAASIALEALSNLVQLGTMKHDSYSLAAKFPWIDKEREVLHCTEETCRRGNVLFKRGEFKEAADEYATALKIDLEVAYEPGMERSWSGRFPANSTAGGRFVNVA
jgi:tetratricopeptide (TPR) repeat protein